MKHQLIFTILLITFVHSQHVPPCPDQYGHSSTGTVCYGYAMSRAFGHTWTTGGCPASTFRSTTNQIHLGFFEKITTYNPNDISVGDIIEFGNGSHVSFVESITYGIKVSQVEYEGSTTEQYNMDLQWVMGGHTNPTVIARDYPTGYYRIKKQWKAKVENGFVGGTVGVGGLTPDSPYEKNDFNWKTYLTVSGSMNNSIFNGYKQIFRSWIINEGDGDISRAEINTGISLKSNNPATIHRATAIYTPELDINFNNSLIGTTSTGVVKINDVTVNAPYLNKIPLDLSEPIYIKPLFQEINGIRYSFDHWQNGSTSSDTFFTPTEHVQLTAYFLATPKPPTNISIGKVSSRNPTVKITWIDNPHADVTQYQIWRSFKPSGGSQTTQYITTVAKGVQSYTDIDYIISNGSGAGVLQYDIRSYFSLNSMYSDPNWTMALAEHNSGESKKILTISKIPVTYTLTNFPNPFNPITTIRYELPEEHFVTLRIFNRLGQEISVLVNEHQMPGFYNINFDASRFASGVYFYKLQAGRNIITQKMILQK